MSNIKYGEQGHDEKRQLPSMSADMDPPPPQIDHSKSRYPYCIVWTPIPLLTWFFPFIGHMGICYSTGVIRDFAGPYFVSEDNMAFGTPTRYVRLDPNRSQNWDRSIYEASEEYKTRMHKLICDNCHSHVAFSLNLMNYKNSKTWNMVKLAAWTFVCGRYVGCCGFIKTWLPSIIIYTIIIVLCTVKI